MYCFTAVTSNFIASDTHPFHLVATRTKVTGCNFFRLACVGQHCHTSTQRRFLSLVVPHKRPKIPIISKSKQGICTKSFCVLTAERLQNVDTMSFKFICGVPSVCDLNLN